MERRTEHGEQAALIEWARYQANLHPALEWLFAIPNGASLSSKAEAIKLKEEGLTPGISDLFLPWASKGYHGFFMEMKRPGNLEGATEGQKEFLEFCEQAGYLGQVFDNFEDAKEAICWYLELNLP